MMLLMAACSLRPSPDERQEEAINIQQNEPGDSSLYGLTCDGCTDSILILLPFSGGDPDTFDIINASQTRQIFGRLHIGDELAVILNPEDKREAQMIINIEALKGQWCYMVTPVWKHTDQMTEEMRQKMMERIPDSIMKRLMQPREYGFRIKPGHAVEALGGVRRGGNDDKMSPVEYPRQRRYREWKLYNGKLILKTDSIRLPNTNKRGKPEYDTAVIQRLRRDTLVLRFKDHEQKYYRKTDSVQISN
jgi:hypothetical protein